jgi:ectoine hydroxylase-related dioxygenase (phytanoyl-CoA dioxygenase family)
MSNTTPVLTISDENKRQFQEEGYMILERVIPEEHLELLRSKAQQFIDEADARMDAQGVEQMGLSKKGSRYFMAQCYKKDAELRRFLFSDLMAQLCQQTLGENAYLFWEQYVIKGAEAGMKFSWHQDSGYVGHPFHQPYLTCWCALDDMSEANGTVHLLPFSQQGIKTYVHHIQDPETNDMVGYFGKEPGIPAIVPAGSIVAFTSVNFHRSGWNRSPGMRRVYLAQYSAEKIMDRFDQKLWGQFEPLLENGQRIDRGEVG